MFIVIAQPGRLFSQHDSYAFEKSDDFPGLLAETHSRSPLAHKAAIPGLIAGAAPELLLADAVASPTIMADLRAALAGFGIASLANCRLCPERFRRTMEVRSASSFFNPSKGSMVALS